MGGTEVGGTDVGGTDVGGTVVGGTDVGGAEVGGTEVGGTPVGGTEVGGTCVGCGPPLQGVPFSVKLVGGLFAPLNVRFIPKPAVPPLAGMTLFQLILVTETDAPDWL